jgi:hypothetical protein
MFVATVSDASDAAVTWQVNGVAGGNSTVGTISQGGVYTSPASTPVPPTVTVTAVSQADPSASASATLTLTAVVPPPQTSVSITPAQVDVATGGVSQMFVATVSDASDAAVTWQVNGVAGGNSTVGTISQGGVYTSPASTPVPPTVTVTAVSASDPTKSASAQVTLHSNPVPLTISGVPATTVTAGQAYTFTPTVSAAAGAQLSFSIANRPSWAAFNTASGQLSGTPSSANVGSYQNISIAVSSGSAMAALAPFTLTVTAAPPVAVTGVCGAANGVAVTVAPTNGLCSAGTASAVSGSGPWSWTCAGSNGGTSASCSAGLASGITGRIVPAPIYGVTLDDVSNTSAEVNSLQQLVHMPTSRIVFDTGEPASYYLGPIQQMHSSSYIMGELADSSYMAGYTAASIGAWTQNYTQTLGSNVDIWEVGNEVNGNWLGSDTLAKIEAMYDVVSGQGGITALTFFYEGEPTDPNNCIDTSNGGNDMFTWINQQFQLSLPAAQRPAETEKIRLHLDYVLISWYPDQCPGESPNWPWVYTQLASLFPNAKVGFGELGTAQPQNGSAYEVNEINQYYPMDKTTAGLPVNYIGGYFWWYFAEEMVPWGTTVLSSTLNAAIQ